jgi:hypothetical protein
VKENDQIELTEGAIFRGAGTTKVPLSPLDGPLTSNEKGIYFSYTPEINSWVRITSITQPKRILVELVIVILFVRALEGALVIEYGSFIWENLVLPLGILMLALAFKFMGFKSQD